STSVVPTRGPSLSIYASLCFADSATPVPYPLSLHDALPIYRRFYSAGNAVIALVGDIDRAGAERIAQRLASALPQGPAVGQCVRSEEHTSELQSRENLVCRLLLEKKKR